MQSRKGSRTNPKIKSADPHLKIFQNAFSLHQQGKLSAAKKLYEEILKNNPKHFDALHLSGVIVFQSRMFDESEAFYAKAVRINSNFAPLHSNRGKTLKELKRFDEALASYDKAISIKSDYAEAFNNRGNTLEELKRFHEALASYDRAISIKSDYAEAFSSRGNTLHELKRFDEALASYDKAISLKLDYAEAFNRRGNILNELQRFNEALVSYEKAISVNSDYAEAFYNLGYTLKQLNRFDEALASYDKAISLKSDYAAAFNSRGNTLHELKRFDDALISYDKAISIKPDYAEPKLGKSINLLLKDNLSEGWRYYEYRLKCQHFINMSLVNTDNFIKKITTLTSVKELTGKHLVLIAEQGLGDVVMFASMVQDILSFVTALDFVVDERLIEILKLSFPSSRVFSSKRYNENDAPTDAVYMFIGSLGRLFRNQISDFPKTPYLLADLNKITNWRNLLQCENKKLIGISWKGGTTHTREWARSFSLQNFLKLIPQDNFKFVNIQHNSSPVEVQQAVDNLNVEIVSFPESDTKNISDLSALLCAVDHVVTVQNSNIHLCGALGVHCVGIIPEIPEWRYGMQRDHMIWYEKVKLLRMRQEIDHQETKHSIRSYIDQAI